MARKNRNPHRHANPAMAAALRGLRVSNAAGAHDPRPNRQRTRAAATRVALRDFA